jgi:hypothetical protein
MKWSLVRPLAIYAIVASAILWAANATDSSSDMLGVGLIAIFLGLQQVYYFERGRFCAGIVDLDRASRPEAFWLGHAVVQTVVFAMVCLPWLEKIAS